MRSSIAAFFLTIFLTTLTSAQADAPKAPTLLCPPQQLRVARCERTDKSANEVDFVIEQMLVCQDKDKNFSLQARYVDDNTNSLKETAPIPATGTRLDDSSVYYTTPTGLNLVLSANREQAVLQQCILATQEVNLARYDTAGSGCLERLAVCK